MTRFWQLLPAALVCTSLVANAQPPGGDRRGGPPADRGPGEGREGPRSGSQVDAWVRTLAEKITDPHDTIRDSARAALVAVGQPALPLLQKLADSDDAAKSTAAKKLIGAIERGNRPAGLASRGGPPAFGGRGMPAGGDRPQGNPRDDRRPMDRRPEGNPRPETDRRPGGDRRPEGRPAEGDRRPETRPMERRPEGGERRRTERE